MESISVFDILKVGIGPSSSHTMGPWKAVQLCLTEFSQRHKINTIESIEVYLYGSLAKTGPGHGTNIAIMLGIMGFDPANIDCAKIDDYINQVKSSGKIRMNGIHEISFDPAQNIIFNTREQPSFHSNALKIFISYGPGSKYEDVFYSIGGGFVVKGPSDQHADHTKLPFPINAASDLLDWCKKESCTISDIVMRNELEWRSKEEIHKGLRRIIGTMKASAYKGCHSPGILPGGLNVKRRASIQNVKLISSSSYNSIKEWIELIKNAQHSFKETLNWVSCFALAVNEENASFGRVVTAPTNGAAGVIPAVMLYYLCFCDDAGEEDLYRFLLVAGELGSIFKKGATISAAMGGCQAEIGVSSAMAAGALTEVQGGTPREVLMAAEIAMEHHLGLTCDPIGGLVQVPCIERNAMGAMKAITASQIALASDPYYARVSLDDVIKTMWDTAEDMNSKYKETGEGGLAINIPVSFPDC
ncbi:MAG: L-serine ammonia-lyase [Cytophagales bacterium]|nr:L-serine ammonia-lyase [Cytophagales bacterium]